MELNGLEWGQAPDGSRYLAKRQTVGEIPEGWNVPVLMYHAVGDEIWGYSDLFVSAASMEEQLQYLQENGYIFFLLLSVACMMRLLPFSRCKVAFFKRGAPTTYSSVPGHTG